MKKNTQNPAIHGNTVTTEAGNQPASKASQPVTVALANTTPQKMEAIVALSHAVEALADALNAPQVAISDCHFAVPSGGTAISVVGK